MASPSMNNCNGNVSIAAKIFAEYGDFIYNVICSKTKNRAEIDDLYQDFFLSLVSKPVPPHTRNIRSYLYKAIINDIIDANRRIQRHKTLMDKYVKNTNFSINESSSTNALNNGKASKIMSLIRGRLSPTQTKAITLRYMDNYSNKEIAKQIGVKKESVSRYICVGLKQIEQILAEEGDIKK